jgi:hypothetical protein
MSETRPRGSGGQWLPDEPGIASGGDVDEDQAGDSYEVRFHRADRPEAMITQTVYPVNASGDYDGLFAVCIETQWHICADPKDPTVTEIWARGHREYPVGSYGTAAEAEGAARHLAVELLHDAGSHTWDGLPD